MFDEKPFHPNAISIIDHYGMHRHPEGGYYLETYRSTGSIPQQALPGGFSGDRAYATAILYLLEAGERSNLHRIRQDETWHFYLGGPLLLVAISPDGAFSEIRLGQDIANGEHLQYTVPAGYWFGATPMADTDYSLVGCTVAPGFDFADFEMGGRDRLTELFPNLVSTIRAFTPSE